MWDSVRNQVDGKESLSEPNKCGRIAAWGHVCGCEVPAGLASPHTHAAAVPPQNNGRGWTGVAGRGRAKVKAALCLNHEGKGRVWRKFAGDTVVPLSINIQSDELVVTRPRGSTRAAVVAAAVTISHLSDGTCMPHPSAGVP
ncbi:hypothetical protein E2C01_042307 [Portunus trituberculatus]|uniref:Uncharacterized protein n=1 Tax=Portunus trituberculatus TaxID=210409 RepID=A0A5B7FUA0_PORTR|nr:hypothetical protein [Portunus trituberculatus]